MICGSLRANAPAGKNLVRFNSTSSWSSVLSTVHRGTLFEKRSRLLLQDHLSMSLDRVGGKDDGGVDLQGWWWLPSQDETQAFDDIFDDIMTERQGRRRIRVLAQCKAEKKKLGPRYIREMEGVLQRHMYHSQNGSLAESHPTVALLVSESPFTKAAVLRAQSSHLPFFLLYLPAIVEANSNALKNEADASHPTIASAMWNTALGGEAGLLRGEVDLRWERPLVFSSESSTSGQGQPVLWWKGIRLKSLVPPP